MFTLQPGMMVGIVASSDPLPQDMGARIEELCSFFAAFDISTKLSSCIFEPPSGAVYSPSQRGAVVNSFYRDPQIQAILDVSGGNGANQILETLEYPMIVQAKKPYIGYSDISVILNAMYSKTGVPGCLFPPLTLTGAGSERKKEQFIASFLKAEEGLYAFTYHFLQCTRMSGVVLGGNLRCTLKLAGTPFWPDVRNAILLLESRSGTPSSLMTLLYQLRQMGAYSKLAGILLGEFTQMEQEKAAPSIEELVLQATAGYDLPIAKTNEIGHSKQSKAIWIGERLSL